MYILVSMKLKAKVLFHQAVEGPAPAELQAEHGLLSLLTPQWETDLSVPTTVMK